MFLHHIPDLVPWGFPQYVWHKSRKEKKVYLTFDDGPVPGVTDFVLEELSLRQMKATFFMVGENIYKHVGLAERVIQQGHQIGNHTFHHLNGRQSSREAYNDNFIKCQQAMLDVLGRTVYLFRPPYGKIKRQQRKDISCTHQIIMWDVIPGDFELSASATGVLSKAQQYTRNGSIILFHDQIKTEKIIRNILPNYLDYLQNNGYQTGIL
jgi:peptidoglycan/xylan/chitin deacetylase (PgdA/CDA1 family)